MPTEYQNVKPRKKEENFSPNLAEAVSTAGCDFGIYAHFVQLCRYVPWGWFFFLGSLKLIFLHIKPHNKDIYSHIQSSTALLWPMVQCWELELIADVTVSWK